MYGARVSLTVAAFALLSGGLIGLAVGIVAGYLGGRVDSILMRVVDATLTFPTILIALLLAVSLGAGLRTIVIAITVIIWARFARVVRGEVLGVKARDFVVARPGARLLAASRIMLVHIVPNVMNTFMVLLTLHIGFVIIVEASLSFLGAGIPPPTPSWGQMVADGRSHIASAWWLAVDARRRDHAGGARLQPLRRLAPRLARPAPQAGMSDYVLEVKDLHAHLSTRWGLVKAVDGVSFAIRAGETLGLVGESGSGKTMTALSLLRLLPAPAGRIVKGQVLLEGEDLVPKSEREMRRVRGRRISMILQDPQTSLNPVFTIGNQVEEALRAHRAEGRGDMRARAVDALRRVKVAAPEERLRTFPHQMSGGMKQRVVGAIALAPEPRLLIADEPTTALDVTIQLQYLMLLKEVQTRMGLAMLFITHDFGIVARMCDRVAVMYAGRIVESGPVRALFKTPRHPYTEALMASVPRMEGRVERLPSIEGQPPALHRLPPGCRFAPRCRYVEPRCRTEYPPTFAVGAQHEAACWRAEP